MRVKICGLTRPADVEAAVAAGADAIGIVLCPSPRRVLDPAPLLAAAGHTEKIAVFRTWSGQDVTGFDRVQAFDFAMAPPLPALPALRDADDLVPPDGHWLLDSAAGGGSGQRADVDRARRLARHGRMVLAGGLAPHDVAAAIAAIRPAAVDVSSGVEVRPGIKNPDAMAAFVAEVRHAFALLESP